MKISEMDLISLRAIDSQNIKELLEHVEMCDKCERRVVEFLEHLEVYNIESPRNIQDPRYNGPI